MFVFTGIPMSPTINRSYRPNMRTGGIARTEEYDLYKKQFRTWSLLNAKQLILASKELIQKRLHATFEFNFLREDIYCKDGRIKTLDLSNRIKTLEDCLCGALRIDDRQIFSLSLIKQESNSRNVKATIKIID